MEPSGYSDYTWFFYRDYGTRDRHGRYNYTGKYIGLLIQAREQNEADAIAIQYGFTPGPFSPWEHMALGASYNPMLLEQTKRLVGALPTMNATKVEMLRIDRYGTKIVWPRL